MPGGLTRTVRIPLNKKGRRLLKKKRKLPVKLTRYTISPRGKSLVESKKVTLRVKGKHKH